MAKQINKDEQKDNRITHEDDYVKIMSVGASSNGNGQVAELANPQTVMYKELGKPTIIRLSAKDYKKFVEALLNPPPVSPALQKAMELYKRLIKESR